MSSNIPNGDYLSQYFQPNYEYQAPFSNYYAESAYHILPCSPSSNDAYPTICSGCHHPIVDSYVMKVLDRSWHPDCLKCYECQSRLTDKCYPKNGVLYCRNDYFRLNEKFPHNQPTTKCAGCNEVILPKQVIRCAQDNMYHLNCFSCYMCLRQLNTGDQFYILEDRTVVCRHDYDSVRSREVDLEVHQKRPRTSITSSQVDLLKNAYNRSSKPSRQTREQLAQETSLDMRVVQVWFQNKRAKEKRLKKESRTKTAPYQIKRETGNKQSKEDTHPLCNPKVISNRFPSDKIGCIDPNTPPMQSFEPLESNPEECQTRSPHHIEHPQPLLDGLDMMRSYTHSEQDWHPSQIQKYETPLLEPFRTNYITPNY